VSTERSDADSRQRPSLTDADPRLVVDAIPAQVWRAASDGAIEFVNQQWIDYTGLSLEQSQGWAWPSSIAPAFSCSPDANAVARG
jgi:PAS domain-containing protein